MDCCLRGTPLCNSNPPAAMRISRGEGLKSHRSVLGAASAVLSSPFRDGRSASSRYMVAEYSSTARLSRPLLCSTFGELKRTASVGQEASHRGGQAATRVGFASDADAQPCAPTVTLIGLPLWCSRLGCECRRDACTTNPHHKSPRNLVSTSAPLRAPFRASGPPATS